MNPKSFNLNPTCSWSQIKWIEFELIFIKVFEQFLPIWINRIANIGIESNKLRTNSYLTPSQVGNTVVYTVCVRCLKFINFYVVSFSNKEKSIFGSVKCLFHSIKHVWEPSFSKMRCNVWKWLISLSNTNSLSQI